VLFEFSQQIDKVALLRVNRPEPVEIFDTATSAVIGTLTSATAQPFSVVTFSHDGALIATGDEAGNVAVWDGTTLTPLAASLDTHGSWLTELAFSADGTALVSSALDPALRVWSTRDWTTLSDVIAAAPLLDVAFSPSGHMLAATSTTGNLYLWTYPDLQRVELPLLGVGGGLNSVLFSPDETRVAAAGFTGEIILWDLASGEPLGDPLAMDNTWILELFFTPDGTQVTALAYTTAGFDSQPLLISWDISVEHWTTRACAIANRNLTHEEWTRYLGAEPYHASCPGASAPGG
jgi:WD40 repeat protein